MSRDLKKNFQVSNEADKLQLILSGKSYIFGPYCRSYLRSHSSLKYIGEIYSHNRNKGTLILILHLFVHFKK